jgi:hypothetical protein
LIDPGYVAGGLVEAIDEAGCYRILSDREDDRNRRACLLCDERGSEAAHSEHGHLTADQIGGKRRESIRLTLRIAIFDCHVLAFDIGQFVQALAERGDLLAQRVGRR